jgi:outer membrane protein assembly factor BamB
MAWVVLALAGCDGKKSSETPPTPVDDAAMTWKTKEWPVTRGGAGLGGRVHDRVPRRPEVEWSFSVKGAVCSEVAVGQGVIVFGDDEGVIHALDIQTRKERWRVETKDAVEATPAISQGRVFAGSNDGSFRALDLTNGKELWQIKGGEKFPTGAVVVPGADGEQVLVNGYDGISRCLRATDGSQVWAHETGDYINGSPALLDDGMVVFGGCDAVIRGISLKDGSAMRQQKTDAQVIRSVAGWKAAVYAVTHANQLVAADITGDKPLWVFENDGNQFLTSPAVDEENVYAGSRDKHLHAVDRVTGKPLWKFQTGGRVESAPLVFDDAVVFGSGDGRLYAVDKKDGHEIWRLDLGEGLPNAPAFAAGRIVIGGGQGTLFVIHQGGTP